MKIKTEAIVRAQYKYIESYRWPLVQCPPSPNVAPPSSRSRTLQRTSDRSRLWATGPSSRWAGCHVPGNTIPSRHLLSVHQLVQCVPERFHPAKMYTESILFHKFIPIIIHIDFDGHQLIMDAQPYIKLFINQ